MKKRFRVDIQIRGTETYYVEANTEQEALELIRKGKIDYTERIINDTYYSDADIIEEQ